MGQRAVGSLLLGLLLHARLLAVTQGLRAYDGLSLPEDTETVTASRYGWTYSYLSDDEDLLADDASGDGLGSGDLGSGDFQMVYFRALVNFTRSIEYSPQLEDANAKEFREVSEAVVEKLETEYVKIPGDQIVSVVFIKELDGWVFVELDVGSEGNADGSQIQEVLHTVVSSGSIGPYVTSPGGSSSDAWAQCPSSQESARRQSLLATAIMSAWLWSIAVTGGLTAGTCPMSSIVRRQSPRSAPCHLLW